MSRDKQQDKYVCLFDSTPVKKVSAYRLSNEVWSQKKNCVVGSKRP